MTDEKKAVSNDELLRQIRDPNTPKSDRDHAAADRLAALESAVIVREDLEAMGYEVPDGTREWTKDRAGECWWEIWNEAILGYEDNKAPDLRPDLEGPVTLPVISLREDE